MITFHVFQLSTRCLCIRYRHLSRSFCALTKFDQLTQRAFAIIFPVTNYFTAIRTESMISVLSISDWTALVCKHVVRRSCLFMELGVPSVLLDWEFPFSLLQRITGSHLHCQLEARPPFVFRKGHFILGREGSGTLSTSPLRCHLQSEIFTEHH